MDFFLCAILIFLGSSGTMSLEMMSVGLVNNIPDKRFSGFTNPIFNITAYDGYSFECFKTKPMSFGTCRLLLAGSHTCIAMSYVRSLCSLHDQMARFLNKSSGGIVIIRQSVDISFSRETVPSPMKKFYTCSKAVQVPTESVMTVQLPRLAIVVSITSSWKGSHEAGVAAMTSNFKCYAAVHNYSFHLNIMLPMSRGQFFHQRHRYVLHRYLPNYQYVMHLDADSLVLNLSRSLEPFLRDDAADVQLLMHENGEVTAAAYLLRNSRLSRCFLRYWLDWSPPHSVPAVNKALTYETLNYDNGDLVSALSDLIDASQSRRCIRMIEVPESSVNAYLDTVVECFLEVVHKAPAISSLKWLKIYLPREGFWRTHARRGRYGSWWDALFGSCFPSSDVIGHGWKAMSRVMWEPSMCDVRAARVGLGANAKCSWHSPQDEVNVAVAYCLWRSPVCASTDCQISCSSTLSRLGGRRHFNHSNEEWILQQLCSSCPTQA